jgi:hypothetical protein
MVKLLLIGLVVFAMNIPFGYWRSNTRRFSLQWFLAIHIPVPFVIAIRLGAHLGFHWTSYVVLVTAFFLGQQFGTLVYHRIQRFTQNISSCLVMDLIRFIGH